MKKIKIYYSLVTLLIASLLLSDSLPAMGGINIDTLAYDTARIYQAMAKARRGEDIKIAVIGGSITAGNNATSESKRWANLVKSWFSSTFLGYGSNVTLINAGIGGTGSNVGVFRVETDVLQYNPDIIIVEFSVNDGEGDDAKKYMEGVIRQILQYPNHPGVMMLLLKQSDGTTAAESHKLVGIHYNVPMISFADLIDDQVSEDHRALSSIFTDGLHPNDIGMQYIADFINEELDTIYSHLPAQDSLIPAIDTVLDAPLVTNIYDNTFQYNSANLIPLTSVNWSLGLQNSWATSIANSEMTFEVEGNAIAIIFTRYNNLQRGMAELWVDDGSHSIVNSYFTENWGPARVYQLVAENIPDGLHTLHIKVLEEHDPASNGNYFQVLNVLKAGSIGNVAPIAMPMTSKQKVLAGTEVKLDGTESFDPDNDSIVSYTWTLDVAPVGNTAAITDPSSDTTQIIPDADGYYSIGLTVNDGNNNSVKRFVQIHAVESNATPVAVAGEDRSFKTIRTLTMDGTGSYDTDGDTLTYRWELVSKPEGSNAYFNFYDYPISYLSVNTDGDYYVTLTVNDSIIDSDPDTIKLTAIADYTDVPETQAVGSIRCFPNPTSGELTINYSLSQNSEVKIDLFSIDGKLIKTLVNELKPAGDQYHIFDLKAYDSASNNLIIRFIIDGKEYSEKIIVK